MIIILYCSFLISESLEKQVQVLYSGPINQIKQIKTILGNQGISVACGPAAHVYTLIIRDVDICNTFCNMISGKYFRFTLTSKIFVVVITIYIVLFIS